MSIPQLLLEEELLLPLKVDVTYNGARVVDLLCFNANQDHTSPHYYSLVLSNELQLPPGLTRRIALQLEEQIESFKTIISTIKNYYYLIPEWNEKVSQKQTIAIGIRHGTIEYSDRLSWDPLSSFTTPEQFADITCNDLRLPNDFKPTIAYKIRESLFRWMINLVAYPNATVEASILAADFKGSETKVKHVQPQQVDDMSRSLWDRARPSSTTTVSAMPQSMLPATNLSCNADVWLPGWKSSSK